MKKLILSSFITLVLSFSVVSPAYAQTVQEQYVSILQKFVSILVVRINMLAEQLEKHNSDSLQIEIKTF
jgi:hypothetical protein